MLTKIGFDASVLEDGYSAIQYARSVADPDENTLVVSGGGIIDKTQMVRHYRTIEFWISNNALRGSQTSTDISVSIIKIGMRGGYERAFIR